MAQVKEPATKNPIANMLRFNMSQIVMLLCEQCFYDLTMYIGQSEITALEAVGQLRVVDAK